MRSEVSVTFKGTPPVRMDLNEVQPMPHDVARWWLDDQFTQMGCEPLRPTGKLLTADKVVVVFATALAAMAAGSAARAKVQGPVGTKFAVTPNASVIRTLSDAEVLEKLPDQD